MIIAQSSLQFSSAHSASTTLNIQETFRSWVDEPQAPDRDVMVTIAPSAAKNTPPSENHPGNIDPKLLLFIRMIEALTGKKIEIKDFSGIGSPAGTGENLASLQSAGQPEPGREAGRQGWGAVYTRSETLTEQEQVAIRASGTITTEDGRSIDVSLRVTMSREYVSRTNLTIRQGDPEKAVDPLVINLDGSTVSLSNVRFSFDLNADGTREDIPFVSPGNGLLALDRNGDGKILDGSELFGPTTGNGFSELARLDDDRNGWIDEKDSFFNKLLIWIKDAEGKDSYLSLKDAGVGAIALAGIQTAYSFKNSQNELLGVLRHAGLYVKENGSVGSMQQIDLAV